MIKLTLALLLLTALQTAPNSACDSMLPKLSRLLQKKVPELDRAAKHLSRTSAGKTRIFYRIGTCPDPTATDTLLHYYYSLEVMEHYRNQNVFLHTFLIRNDLKNILFYEVPSDSILTLAQARRSQAWNFEL